MGKAKRDKRSNMKPFVKVINFNHIMPTRYSVDIDLKKFDGSSIEEGARVDTRKQIKKIFQEKYTNQTAKSDRKSQGVAYFFNKLRF